MNTIENIKIGLIDKILSIKNKDLLVALENYIASNSAKSKKVQLNFEQITMLEMSEKDILNGDLISQEAMNNRNLEWLNSI